MEHAILDFEAQVLDLARRRTQQAEVFCVESVDTPVIFEANRLKQMNTHRMRGVSLRVIADGKVGLASTTRLEDAGKLVENALAVAQFGASVHYHLPAAIPDQPVALYDEAVATLSVESMVEMGQRMIDRALADNGALLCEAELERSVVEMRLSNSLGAGAGYRKTSLAAGLGANWIRGTDMLDVWESQAGGRLDLRPEQLVDLVLEKVHWAERLASVPTAQLPVVFSPKGIAGTLLNSLATGFNGKMVLEGASPVGDKLGQPVFSPRLNLYDDGLIDYALGSAPFDDEGIPTRRTPLVQDGVVMAFLYDLHTASMAGTESTGNADRSLGSLPSPTAHTLWMRPGEASLQEMLADIKEGVLIDQVMGAWAGNVLSGEFSGNVHLGYRIENGRLVGRVKDTMVSGNVFQALSDIAAIGSELHWVGGSLRLPYLYIPALGVASKGN